MRSLHQVQKVNVCFDSRTSGLIIMKFHSEEFHYDMSTSPSSG